MATTNFERVGKALELLKTGVVPFIEREFKAKYGTGWAFEVKDILSDTRLGAGKTESLNDIAASLVVMDRKWSEVFRQVLGKTERSLVNELLAVRNSWAHQENFSSDDAYRALDSAARLLTAISAPQASEVEKMKTELLRVRFDEQARGEKRKSAGTAIESGVTGSLKPWREVVMPHEDVASGRYQQAEFAADLWQVHLGEGTPEYRDPVEFFRRTYLTASLTEMLVGAVRRLTVGGGDPVVQLQTNFGAARHTRCWPCITSSRALRRPSCRASTRSCRRPAPRARSRRSGWCWSATRFLRATRRPSPMAPWCAHCGANSPGNWAARKLSPACRPTTRTPLAPATCCASCSTTTVPA
jgi:Predicted ATPase (AAA+ superfamily)